MGFITQTDQAYHEGGDIGNYQYVQIDDIINNFILMFTGSDKVIPKASRTEVQMHAKRCIQEFSYDVFKTYKSHEIEIPPSLTMQLPKDYVNYTAISYTDQSGVEHPLYPTGNTSNPMSIIQDSDYEYTYDLDGELLLANNSVTWQRFQDASADTLDSAATGEDPMFTAARGERFGIDPEHAQSNGVYFIDRLTGLIHFSGHVTGSVVTLKYLSDGMGTDGEMVVHKFAEDAVYKYILYSIIAVTGGSQEYLVRRYLKSFVAAKRVAKIRLGNWKSIELAQAMRGKSKQIKH